MEIQERLTFLLDTLSVGEYESIKEYVQLETFDQGEEILKQGEQGQRFFMIKSGSVEVLLEGVTTITLALLHPGEFFGEISCLTKEPITATVKALEKVQTYVMSREGLLKLLDIHPQFMRHILDQLLKRMTKSNERVQQENLKSSVIIESALSEGERKYREIIGSSPLIRKVKEEIDRLSYLATPLFITGEKGVGKKFVAGYLHYQGSRKQAPFLTGSGLNFNMGEWRRKQQAAAGGTLLLTEAEALPVENVQQIVQEAVSKTRIILTGTTLPEGLQLERLDLPPLRERREDLLALIKECLRREGFPDLNQAISSAAIRKLQLYPFLNGNIQELFDVLHKATVLSQGSTIYPEHIHLGGSQVRKGRPTIGLALGAGAVRGSAHVGVLKVLEEEGIPIDLIAGCSVGALVGALYAAGKSIAYMEEKLPKVNWNQLTSFSWPKDGFLNNQKMEKWLRQHVGDIRVEELELPFAAVATDAQSGMPVILNSGPVAPIIRASTAIPLIMKPVRYDQKLLWDGSIVHKVPIHLARSMGADVVIGVDVGLPAFKKGKVNNLFDAFMFPLDIMQESMAQDEMDLADVLLQPSADSNGYSFKSAPLFFTKGEEVTREAIGQIRKVIEMVGKSFS